MAASLRSCTPQVTAPTLAQQGVPRANGPDGEKLSRSEWCGRRDSNPRPQPWQVWACRSQAFADVREPQAYQQLGLTSIRVRSHRSGDNHFKTAPQKAPDGA